MNNLLIALALLIPGGALWWHQSHQHQRARAASVQLAGEIAGVESALESIRRELDNSTQLLEARRSELQTLRLELTAGNDANPVTPAAADPGEEGTWPVNRPYFYLPKNLLTNVGYNAVTLDHRITPIAATLFGLTPAETVRVNDTLRSFRLGIEQLQLERASPVHPPLKPNSEDHREVSYRLPSLTSEVQSLRNELDEQMASILGHERSGYLQARIGKELFRTINPIGHADVVITFSADRDPEGYVRHRLRFADPERIGNHVEHDILFDPEPHQGLMSGEVLLVAGIGFPIEPFSPLWNYRHLFGDQPLIPPAEPPTEPPIQPSN